MNFLLEHKCSHKFKIHDIQFPIPTQPKQLDMWKSGIKIAWFCHRHHVHKKSFLATSSSNLHQIQYSYFQFSHEYACFLSKATLELQMSICRFYF